jgi:hypothetical protein
MTDDATIETLYGGELASQLVAARIPFSTTFVIENQTMFHIPADHAEHAFEMMGMIRRTKLR